MCLTEGKRGGGRTLWIFLACQVMLVFYLSSPDHASVQDREAEGAQSGCKEKGRKAAMDR